MLNDFTAPVPEHIIKECLSLPDGTIFSRVNLHREVEGMPDLTGIQVAILGVQEDRGSRDNAGCAAAADAIRPHLYRLFFGHWNLGIADLGNIYSGETPEDTRAALRMAVEILRRENIIPVIIGGSQDLTYGNYRAYDSLEQTVNLVSIDSRFDLGQQAEKLHSGNFLSHIVLNKPYNLFNYANLGYQTYFVPQEEIDLMDRMHFETHRLGVLRRDIGEVEPVVRDADIVSFDNGAIRLSDAPGSRHGSPNGLSGEEACAVARYSGLSDKVSSFGIYEYNPALDGQGSNAKLLAQMIWYFMEGVQQRTGDYPFARKDDYTRFTVLIDANDHELIFYRSPMSERWWIEVPIRLEQHQRHALIPCSHKDYLSALEGLIPDRWWKAQKRGL